MGAWFLIIAAGMTVVMWRLISVASVIWRERARVASHCTQMETAALNGAVLCERLPDGTTLLVMPGPAHDEHDSADPRRGPGDLIGEHGAPPAGLRSATVIAVEAVLALVISTEDFAAIIGEHPHMNDIVKMQAYDRWTG